MDTKKNISPNGRAILLIHCPDEKGLISTITEFLHKNGGNIIYLDQHVDTDRGIFFMRVEWELTDFVIPDNKIYDYFKTLIADRYNMTFRLYLTHRKPRMAILVSKLSHCLYDLLSRVYSGEWNVEIPLVISNHPNMEELTAKYNIPYYHLPINKDNKKEQEKKQLELMQEHEIDFIVLARYMQVLSGDFIEHYKNKIINIHHSFLPAFPGAKPYHSAHERGVKIIGATSHYVTAELDGGPIIEQDIIRITHKESVNNLIRKGKELEKLVLSRAVWLHLQRRILAYDNRTVVFE